MSMPRCPLAYGFDGCSYPRTTGPRSGHTKVPAVVEGVVIEAWNDASKGAGDASEGAGDASSGSRIAKMTERTGTSSSGGGTKKLARRQTQVCAGSHSVSTNWRRS